MKLLKTKWAKIAITACAAAAVLAAVFFLQPGPEKREIPAATAAALIQEETAALSQQAQGMLPAIDVDAVLRQTQAEATDAPAATQLPAAQTQLTFPQTSNVIATTMRTQPISASTAAKTTAKPVVVSSTAPTVAATTTKAVTSAPTATATTIPLTTTTQAQLTCTISVRCDTILAKDRMDRLPQAKRDIVPANGVILQSKSVSFTEGESVFDVLKRAAQSERIHLDFENNPMYSSAYIAAIGNLYEKDGGDLSGWMYRVNGVYPNYGCGRYTLKAGDVVEWLYTCDLGKDIGGEGITQR